MATSQETGFLPPSATGYDPNSRPTTRAGLHQSSQDRLSRAIAAENQLAAARAALQSDLLRIDNSQDLSEEGKRRQRVAAASQCLAALDAIANVGVNLAAEAEGTGQQIAAKVLSRRLSREPARQAVLGEVREVLLEKSDMARNEVLISARDLQDLDILEAVAEWPLSLDRANDTKLSGTIKDVTDRAAVYRYFVETVIPDAVQERNEAYQIALSLSSQIDHQCNLVAKTYGVALPAGLVLKIEKMASAVGSEWGKPAHYAEERMEQLVMAGSQGYAAEARHELRKKMELPKVALPLPVRVVNMPQAS